MRASLSHGCLYVVDRERMARFYRSVFGCEDLAPAAEGFLRLVHPEGAGLALHTVPAAYAPTVLTTTTRDHNHDHDDFGRSFLESVDANTSRRESRALR